MDLTNISETSSISFLGRLWFFEIIIGIVALVTVNFIFKRLVKHMRKRSLSTSSGWMERIDHILFLPFQVLMWVLGATLVIEVLGRQFDFAFFANYINAFRSSGFVACCVWVLLRWKDVYQRDILTGNRKAGKVDAGFIQMSGRMISIAIVVMGLMIIFQIWGLNIAPLIAFGGIGAAALGFAAKDVIGNFYGGLMLHLSRPFVVGDYIFMPEKDLEGTVEEIGWYLTSVRNRQKRPVYVPNSIFSQMQVINGSRMSHRHVEDTVRIRYDDFTKVQKLVDSIKETVSQHPEIDTHLPVMVFLQGFKEYSLEIYFNFYVLETRYDKFLQVKQELMMIVHDEITKAGASLAVPILSLLNRPTPQPSELTAHIKESAQTN